MRRDEVSLTQAYEAAKAQLVGCAISFPDFARLATSLEVSAESAAARGTDLCLAWSAGLGDRWALTFIENEIISAVHRRLRSRGVEAATADDVLQTVRTKLFVDRPPRALRYNGTAPLAHWLFVIAMRTFVDHRRKDHGLDLDRVAEYLMTSPSTASSSPGELRDQFRAALKSEIRRLSSRDRTIIRLHFLEGVPVESIAKMFRVHRVTVARWLWRAGEAIQAGLRQTFRDRLGVASQEFDSLARRLPSQLDYDLSSALKSSHRAAAD